MPGTAIEGSKTRMAAQLREDPDEQGTSCASARGRALRIENDAFRRSCLGSRHSPGGLAGDRPRHPAGRQCTRSFPPAFRRPDTGSIFQFKGGGKISGFGDPTVNGRIHTIGLIAQGHAAGYLILKGGGGTLTLNLIGPEQINGPEGLPDVFAFTTRSGTGKFKHVFDSGSIGLVSTLPGQTIGGTHGAVNWSSPRTPSRSHDEWSLTERSREFGEPASGRVRNHAAGPCLRSKCRRPIRSGRPRSRRLSRQRARMALNCSGGSGPASSMRRFPAIGPASRCRRSPCGRRERSG